MINIHSSMILLPECEWRYHFDQSRSMFGRFELFTTQGELVGYHYGNSIFTWSQYFLEDRHYSTVVGMEILNKVTKTTMKEYFDLEISMAAIRILNLDKNRERDRGIAILLKKLF